MVPNGEHDEDEIYDPVVRGKRKPRRKKPQDKWNSMYFIPKDTLNIRNESSTAGRRGSRQGLKLYRELGCKVCKVKITVSHKRFGLSDHLRDFHNNVDLRTPSLGSSVKRTVVKSRAKKRNLSESSDYSDIEIVDDDIEVIEPEPKKREKEFSLVSKTFDNDMIENLSKSLVFQPEVSLSLKLTYAMKHEANLSNPKPDSPCVNSNNIASKISNIRASLNSLLNDSSAKDNKDDDECIILDEDTLPNNTSQVTPVSDGNKTVNSLKRKSIYLTPNTIITPEIKKLKHINEIQSLDKRGLAKKTESVGKPEHANIEPAKEAESTKKDANNSPKLSKSFQSTMTKLKKSLAKKDEWKTQSGNKLETKAKSQIDWRSVIEGKSPNLGAIQTPEQRQVQKKQIDYKKRQFKPISLLDQFDQSKAIENDKSSGEASIEEVEARVPSSMLDKLRTPARKKQSKSVDLLKEILKVRETTENLLKSQSKHVNVVSKAEDEDDIIEIVEETVVCDSVKMVRKEHQKVSTTKNSDSKSNDRGDILCTLEERICNLKEKFVDQDDLVIIDDEETTRTANKEETHEKKNRISGTRQKHDDEEILLDEQSSHSEEREVYSIEEIEERESRIKLSAIENNEDIVTLDIDDDNGDHEVSELNETLSDCQVLDEFNTSLGTLEKEAESDVADLINVDEEADIVELLDDDSNESSTVSKADEYIARIKAKLNATRNFADTEHFREKVQESIVDCF